MLCGAFSSAASVLRHAIFVRLRLYGKKTCLGRGLTLYLDTVLEHNVKVACDASSSTKRPINTVWSRAGYEV